MNPLSLIETTEHMNTPPALPLGAGDFVDTAAVAELLACTTRTVTRLIQRGILPAVRLGPGRSSYRVPVAGLLDFIARHGHHEPSTVTAARNPDGLPAFTPEPVALHAHRTPDGLLLVTPYRPPDEGLQDG